MKVIDLFAGAGGISVGLKNAGYNIVLANEIDKDFAKTYKRNHVASEVVCDDVEIFVKNLNKYKNEQIDLIVGGTPCQGFSMAGARIRKNQNILKDSRNYLFRNYFEVIQYFEPKYFIFENVEGLTTLNKGNFLKEIVRLFTNKDNFKKGKYFLNYKIVNVANFGVPQKRKRFIMIGSKRPFPELDAVIKKYLSSLSSTSKYKQSPNIRQTIGDLNYIEVGGGEFEQRYKCEPNTKYQKMLRNGQVKLFNHVATKHNKVALSRIIRLKPGDSRSSLNDKHLIKSVHSGAYSRMKWEDQAVTITTRFDTPSGGKFIHPERNRTITPREAARLQSFPDEFVFMGPKSKITTMIGNAVPPLFAEFLGNIIKYINKNY